MIKINYKSDFKINESSETVAMEVPFVFSYYVFDSKKYVVSFDGHNYVNCERKEDGSLDVIFNQPDFGIGHLKVERKYAVDDKSFADGVFDVVTVDKTDVFITSGKTFENYVKTLVVPPYLKGDKGDPMTWSTMAETEREELVHDVAEAIDPEMVMTENEKSRQEAERSRQTAEQQRSTTFNTLKGEMQSAITAGNAAAENAQKVVNEYDTKVSEQDSKLAELGSEVELINSFIGEPKSVSLDNIEDSKYINKEGKKAASTTLYGIFTINVTSGTYIEFTTYATDSVAVIAEKKGENIYSPIVIGDVLLGVHTYGYRVTKDCTIALSGRIGSTSTEDKSLYIIDTKIASVEDFDNLNSKVLEIDKRLEKYGSLLTDITLSYRGLEDTFTFNESEGTMTINDNIYLYPIGKSRILLDSSILSSPINLGIPTETKQATRFIVFDSNDETIKSIIPYSLQIEKEDDTYIFAIVQKIPYKVGNVEFSKYEVHTKNNAHRSLSKGFDGVFSTHDNSTYFGRDNIKTPGVYIRRDSTSTRGGLLFVSVTNGVISQSYLEIGTKGKFLITERVFDNDTETWSSSINTNGFEFLNLPTFSLNGNIIFENSKITFKGSAYLYTKTSRIQLPQSGDLSLTAAITKLVWDRKNNVIYDATANSLQDGYNDIMLGLIIRDSNGNIKKALLNAACQDIIYPIQDKAFTSMYNPSKVKYIPHRGIRNAEIPENTTYSVMYAALYGLEYAECDVRYTSDGIGVVMHDTTINRTMYNSDLSAISGDVSIAGNTYEDLSQYVYKSTNEVYRTRLQTMKEYIDACAEWNICPIIQGSMSDDDLSYCMQRLGDNWICYGGNFAKVRAYSQNVLCLTSASYNSVDAMVTALRGIGGNVGLSRLYNSELTDEYIAACKDNRWEVMASYAYEHSNIPDAIRRGATIILSDNVGKDTNKVLASSLKNWESFTHNGTISANTLVLSTGQYLNKYIEGKGSYKIYIQFTGEGTITLPNYDNDGNYGRLTFPMNNGVFIYTFTLLEEEGFTLSIDTTSTMSIERFIICCEEVAL